MPRYHCPRSTQTPPVDLHAVAPAFELLAKTRGLDVWFDPAGAGARFDVENIDEFVWDHADDEDAVLFVTRAWAGDFDAGLDIETLTSCPLRGYGNGALFHVQADGPEGGHPLLGTDTPIGAYTHGNVVLLPFWVTVGSADVPDDHHSWEVMADWLASVVLGEEEVPQDTQAQRLAQTITRRSSAERTRLVEIVEEVDRDTRNLERRLRQERDRITDLRAQIRAIEAAQVSDAGIEERAARELEAIKSHPMVRRVRVTTRSLFVHTDTLTMRLTEDPFEDQEVDFGAGDETTAGKFKLVFDFVDKTVRVTNETRGIGRYDHPHVSNGEFCLGDQRDLVNGLMERMDFSATVAVIIDLLQQVNPRDTYNTEVWPEWFDEANFTDEEGN